MSPEKLAEAMQRFRIDDNGPHRIDNRYHDTPTIWFVVDTSTAETDVNWPGDLISEHASFEEARIGLAKALIEYASK